MSTLSFINRGFDRGLYWWQCKYCHMKRRFESSDEAERQLQEHIDRAHKRCERCAEPEHTEVDYDDCVRAHQPDTDDQCDCPCMENYDPTDEQLHALAQPHRSYGFRGGFA